MIGYFKAHYPAIGWRFFLVCRWALFILWLHALRFILFIGPASNDWFGELFCYQLAVWAAISAGFVIAHWVIAGQWKPKVFLPWTKLGEPAIEARQL